MCDYEQNHGVGVHFVDPISLSIDFPYHSGWLQILCRERVNSTVVLVLRAHRIQGTLGENRGVLLLLYYV